MVNTAWFYLEIDFEVDFTEGMMKVETDKGAHSTSGSKKIHFIDGIIFSWK